MVTLARDLSGVAQPAILDQAWVLLAGIPDPEIPAISIVDLGLVGEVSLAGGRLVVTLLPTFVGCPALEMVRAEVLGRLGQLADEPGSEVAGVAVATSYNPPWTAERISAAGRRALVASGFAPPAVSDEAAVPRATCPYCGSRRTVLENAFGPTRCRSIHYCTDCRQPFEQFKDA
jgi:ring-1,2-phenylacetyl-CoA epoxidase subunit PaaD